MWGIKLPPPERQIKSSNKNNLVVYREEEDHYDPQSLVDEQRRALDLVRQAWDFLSTFELSAAMSLNSCIRMINRDVNPQEKVPWLSVLGQHTQAIKEALDDLEPDLYDAKG